MTATLETTVHPDRLASFVPEQRPGRVQAGSGMRAARNAGRQAQLLLVSDGLAGVAALSVHPSGTPLAGVVVLLAVLALADSDLYRRRLRLSVMDDLAQLWFRGMAAPTAVGAALLLLDRVEEGSALLTGGVTFVVLALAARGVLYRALARQRVTGRRGENALVLGLGGPARELVGALRRHPGCGVHPAAYVSDRRSAALDGLPVLALDHALPGLGLPALAEQTRADVVFVTPSHLANADVVTALRALGRSGCDVFVLPALSDLGMWRGHTEEVGGLPLIRLRRSAHRSLAWRAKRPLDLLLAAAGLLVCLPVIGLCALAARIDGGPGVLFRQQRIGLDGEPFTIYKIRSLRPADRASRPPGGTCRPTPVSPPSAACCAAPRSTSCRSCGTSSAAT